MRTAAVIFILVIAMMSLSTAPVVFADPAEPDDYKVLKEIIVLEFSRETPHEWGTVVTGVKTRMKTEEKVVAVTLEAGEQGEKRIDDGFLKVLEDEKIPATLFVSGPWLDQNPDKVKQLAANPQFEIANLGFEAKSCSVDGRSPNGSPATKSAEEVFTEIEKNARKIESLTGVLPRFFRAGAAYYDDVAVRIARALGYEVVGSGVVVEKTSRAVTQGIVDGMLKAPAGSIAAISLSRPGEGAAQGLKQAISKLRAKGFRFVKLGDYPLE